MRYTARLAGLAAALAVCAGAAVAAEETALPAVAPSSLRYTPIVKAVQKTKPSVVTIRVPRPGGGKDLIGTGVIFDTRGYIVTNNHVVAKKAQVTVRLNDGSELIGDVRVNEPSFDLAIVKINTSKKLEALPFGSVNDLMVGEPVIAVGHPFGYHNTVSQGIISALERDLAMPSGDRIAGLIQTDASINPGNSGGPLMNIEGEWIGVNVAIRDGAQGIAFAINVGTVQSVLARHMSSQHVGGQQLPLVAADPAVAAASQSTSGAGVGVSTGSGR